MNRMEFSKELTARIRKRWKVSDVAVHGNEFSFTFFCPCGFAHEEEFALPQVFAEPKSTEELNEVELIFCEMMLNQELAKHVEEGIAMRAAECR